MSKKILKVTFTQTLDLRECEEKSLDFKLPFVESHGIYNFGKSFALVCKKDNTVTAIFDALKNVALNAYILSRTDTDELVMIVYSNNKLHIVEEIEEFKAFKEYILVKYLDGKKELYYISNDTFRKCQFSSLKEYTSEKSYVVLKLPNDKFTLVTEDLKVADAEFSAIKEDLRSFVIVKFDNMFQAYAVIRLSDLEVSTKYFNIHFFGKSDEYVQVYEFANPPKIMKVSNFETSDGYLSIQYISEKYALVKEDCYSEEKILRLNDFAVSKWDKKEKMV